MKEQIGETAGRIWNTLREHQELSLSRIPKVGWSTRPWAGWPARTKSSTVPSATGPWYRFGRLTLAF